MLEDGELGTRPLRIAGATDHYPLAGDGTETWEPRFTFHGFRYAEIDGWPGDFDPAEVTAVVVHSDMGRTGWFESSDTALNRLHENVVWGMRGNFLYVPTDCPQRDERLGWTGDIQVFAPTASFLYDCAWLPRLLAARPRGRAGTPRRTRAARRPRRAQRRPVSQAAMAVWGDAATIVPWVLHQRFGDLEVLRDQYPSMRRWVDSRRSASRRVGLWAGKFQFGDWLDPTAPPDNPLKAKTDPDIVATAYLAYSLRIVAGYGDSARPARRRRALPQPGRPRHAPPSSTSSSPPAAG